MASAPQNSLPLFFQDLMPLNSRDHAKWHTRQVPTAPFLKGQHAVPLTCDEFVEAQRHFPIVFSTGPDPLPLALMGLNEGINTFMDDEGRLTENVYVPAYVRRYPYMLARLSPDTDDLSLCFDPTSDVVGEFDEGQPLFDDEGKPSQVTQDLLAFCQRFEEAGVRTKSFIDELKKHDLLMEGEIAITRNDDPDKPYVYRGFQMINQEKLRDVRGDVLRTWNQNGLILLIHAHIFSLNLMKDIFARQAQQGRMPERVAAANA